MPDVMPSLPYTKAAASACNGRSNEVETMRHSLEDKIIMKHNIGNER